ncbi:TPA: hypothetical protein TZC46_001182 [Streptococcus suis]|nr:hypothetical protein [Streptococcus suis]
MTTNVVQFIPKHDICHECYKRKATKLCDFIIGQTGTALSFSLGQADDYLTVERYAYKCTQEEAQKYQQFRWVALEDL